LIININLHCYSSYFFIAYLVPLLEEEAARFFRSLSLPLSFLFSLSVVSESLLPVLSFRLRALNSKRGRGGKQKRVKIQTNIISKEFPDYTLGISELRDKSDDTPTVCRIHANNGGLPGYEANVTHGRRPVAIMLAACEEDAIRERTSEWESDHVTLPNYLIKALLMRVRTNDLLTPTIGLAIAVMALVSIWRQPLLSRVNLRLCSKIHYQC